VRSATEGKAFGERARYWDCFYGDRTDEVEFWARIAADYGNRILMPMSATGEVAVGLAKKGFEVFALECCPVLVEKSRSRGEGVASFHCLQNTLLDVDLEGEEFDFVLFASGDYHYFPESEDRETALENVHRLLKPGGGFGLELMPFSPDRQSTAGIDHDPCRQPDDGSELHIHTWTNYNPNERLLAIHQVLTIHSEEETRQVESHIPVPLFTRVDLQAQLSQCGFRGVKEYGGYDGSPYLPSSPQWILSARRCRGC
jgi:SAM-dependent methyltransferase